MMILVKNKDLFAILRRTDLALEKLIMVSFN